MRTFGVKVYTTEDRRKLIGQFIYKERWMKVTGVYNATAITASCINGIPRLVKLSAVEHISTHTLAEIPEEERIQWMIKVMKGE